MKRTLALAAVYAFASVACQEEDPCPTPTRGETMLEPEFVRIEPGTFWMGSTDPDAWESNRIKVTITRPYLIQRTEVTRAEWMRAYRLAGENSELKALFPIRVQDKNVGSCTECPAEMVYLHAVMHANWRSQLDGFEPCYDTTRCQLSMFQDDKWDDSYQMLGCYTTLRPSLDCEGYRLPTEAEWEYAARAGGETDWSCGGIECVDEVAWHRRHPDLNPLSWADPASTYMRVATLCPNDWGIYDMSGNAFEWTADAVDRDVQRTRHPFHYADEAVDPFRPIHPVEFSSSTPNAFVVPSKPVPLGWTPPARVVRGGWAWSYPEGTRITMSQWASAEQLGGVRLVRKLRE